VKENKRHTFTRTVNRIQLSPFLDRLNYIISGGDLEFKRRTRMNMVVEKYN